MLRDDAEKHVKQVKGWNVVDNRIEKDSSNMRSHNKLLPQTDLSLFTEPLPKACQPLCSHTSRNTKHCSMFTGNKRENRKIYQL